MNHVLLACGKTKRKEACPAVHLYIGNLYTSRLKVARKMGGPRWILSALHGLIEPMTVIEPYDITLRRMSDKKQQEWSEAVAKELLMKTAPGDSLVVFGGSLYVKGWKQQLVDAGRVVLVPCYGLMPGQEMQRLKGMQ